jgi:hypothetical protein
MNFPDVEIRIVSPSELAGLLRHAKRCVAEGTLRPVAPPADAPFARTDLAGVPDEGPWPDYIEAYFEDARGRRYKLAVETYHGSGGSWSRV